jgi:hypothetical protein
LDKVRFALRYLKVEWHRGVVALKGVSMEANQPIRGEPKKERLNFFLSWPKTRQKQRVVNTATALD